MGLGSRSSVHSHKSLATARPVCQSFSYGLSLVGCGPEPAAPTRPPSRWGLLLPVSSSYRSTLFPSWLWVGAPLLVALQWEDFRVPGSDCPRMPSLMTHLHSSPASPVPVSR